MRIWAILLNIIRHYIVNKMQAYYLNGLIIISIILFLGGLARVIYYEYRINKLNKEKEEKINGKSGQGRGITLAIIQGQQKKIKIEYDKKIEILERKRRFILDKLHFLRK